MMSGLREELEVANGWKGWIGPSGLFFCLVGGVMLEFSSESVDSRVLEHFRDNNEDAFPITGVGHAVDWANVG